MRLVEWMVAGSLVLLAVQAGAEEAQVLRTKQDVQSYGIGVNIAKSFKRDGIEIDMELLVKGMRDFMSGERLLMPERDMRRAMNALQSEVRQKAAARNRIAAEDNKKKGEAFLAENRNKEGVVALTSGVQYKVLTGGDGKMPAEGDQIECNYRGTLLDGTEFDGTDPGRPATLKVSQLIPGWKEAVKLMPEGSRWMVYIPSQLAYGSRGVGSDIGPNEALVFEVELLAVK